MNKKREIADIILGYLGAMAALYGLDLFNQHILMTLPLTIRMIANFLLYWAVAAIPVIIILLRKDMLSDYGFSKAAIPQQIFIGICIGVALSLVFTLMPHLLGFGNLVDNGHRYRFLWQFAYDFLYCIFAVGLVEEFLFRGFFYEKIRRISNTEVTVISSSALFGLFHLFRGNVIQMAVTALLGIVFCLCKNKIKHCSTLSLVIAHGIYDALITVLAALFL